MPVLDWTRTDLALPGAERRHLHALRHRRLRGLRHPHPGAPRRRRGLSRGRCATRRTRRFAAMDDAHAGSSSPATSPRRCPARPRRMTLDRVREHLAEYGDISPEQLREHFVDFLGGGRAGRRGGRRPALLPSRRSAVLAARPAAHHVDRGRLRRDPRCRRQPGQRHDALLRLARRAAGQRPAGDDAALRRRRCTSCTCATSSATATAVAGSFFEAEHLGGDTDMVALIAAIVARGSAAARPRAAPTPQIPMRPDHGQDILDDLGRRSQPGYPDDRPAQGPRRAARRHDRAHPPGARARRVSGPDRAGSALCQWFTRFASCTSHARRMHNPYARRTAGRATARRPGRGVRRARGR